jgi:serine/threonine protein kinase
MNKERLAAGVLLDQGRFEVVRPIKAGGMGAVYEVADHRLDGKTFALKEMINPGVGTDEQVVARDRFISEVQVMRSLRHPNIPRITESFIHGNNFYFVMELVRGTDLSLKLKQDGSPGLPPTTVVGWALQILDALDYLHNRLPPVVHRDIKPSNLLLDETQGRVYLIDFGISCINNPGEGLWIGSRGYAPPEQQFGRPEPRSDLYALGATMHQLISGIKPKDFEFEELKTDSDLNEAIFAALAQFPNDRIASAAAMRDLLTGLRNIRATLPSSGDSDFEGAVHSYKSEVLDPALNELIRRYGNECQTRFLSHSLDYLQFVLANPTPFELQILRDEQKERIVFRQKAGILDAKVVGEIDPRCANRERLTREVLDIYVQSYEESKSSSWGLAF